MLCKFWWLIGNLYLIISRFLIRKQLPRIVCVFFFRSYMVIHYPVNRKNFYAVAVMKTQTKQKSNQTKTIWEKVEISLNSYQKSFYWLLIGACFPASSGICECNLFDSSNGVGWKLPHTWCWRSLAMMSICGSSALLWLMAFWWVLPLLVTFFPFVCLYLLRNCLYLLSCNHM